MRPRTIGYGLAAGVAAFLVVGVAGTEVGTAAGIEFSLFVGIPAGLAAGVAASAVVFLRFEDAEPGRRRPALALAGFGAAFVATLLVVAVLGTVGVLRVRNTVALVAAAAVGVGGAVLAALRGA